jgi:hypothetical protein
MFPARYAAQFTPGALLQNGFIFFAFMQKELIRKRIAGVGQLRIMPAHQEKKGYQNHD